MSRNGSILSMKAPVSLISGLLKLREGCVTGGCLYAHEDATAFTAVTFSFSSMNLYRCFPRLVHGMSSRAHRRHGAFAMLH